MKKPTMKRGSKPSKGKKYSSYEKSPMDMKEDMMGMKGMGYKKGGKVKGKKGC